MQVMEKTKIIVVMFWSFLINFGEFPLGSQFMTGILSS